MIGRCVQGWRRTCDAHTAGPGRRSESGFTLVEIMAVMVIVITLAGIATIGYGTAMTRSREAVLKEDLFRMRDAIAQYFADRTEYPASLEALVSERYLRTIPDDPFTESSTTWQTVMADYDPANPLSQGIYDVHSGSVGLAIDGSPYAEW